LLMRYPKEIKAGTVVSKLVQNLDYAPTILDYAGVAKPAEMQGESFRKLTTGKPVHNWRKALYYHYYEYPAEHKVKRHYGIRTDRYKLIHFYYDVDEWELYDLQKDPHEMQSVYNDPAYAPVRKALHKQLDELRKKYKDSPGLMETFPEKK
ncbi:MAG: sulfatase/phosphatase domain-containing protein, partial [Daejeonella sp.]